MISMVFALTIAAAGAEVQTSLRGAPFGKLDLASLGVINASAAPFFADSSGVLDSTQALQAAFDAGYNLNRTVFLPLGTYKVTDTLNCTMTWDYPWWPDFRIGTHVIVGEVGVVDGQPRRPVLWLPPSTPGFTDPAMERILLWFQWNSTMTKDPFFADQPKSQPMNNINQVLQGVDVRIDEGNFGAIGIHHRGAQGSALEDVTIWAGDASVGVVGAAGGGGAHYNVQVLGGRYGMDLRFAQPSPTVVGVRLLDQRCSAIVYTGHGPLTVVGAELRQNSSTLSQDSVGLLAGGLDVKAFTGECQLPVWAEMGWTDKPTFGGSVSLVDSRIQRLGDINMPAPAIVYARGLFVRNSYFSGFAVLASSGISSPVEANASEWMRVDELAVSEDPPAYNNLNYTSPLYLDGARTSAQAAWLSAPLTPQLPPKNLRLQHLWNETNFPSFQQRGAVDARSCGVRGDGHTDDAGALQRCVDKFDLVVLPKGFYRLSRTLELRRIGGALVGVGRTLSVLMPTSVGFGDHALIRVSAKAATLFQLSYLSFWHTDSWLLHWTSSATGNWRQCHGFRSCDLLDWQDRSGHWQRSCQGYPAAWTKQSTRPQTVISGLGRFYSFYIETYRLQAASYRHLLVDSSKDAHFYHVNPEHSAGETEMEVVNSHGLRVYGMKSERNFCLLWLRNSSDVLFTGFGGTANAFPLNHTWTPGADGYQPGYSNFTPSLFRIEHSQNVSLANLWGDGHEEGGSVNDFNGAGFDDRSWAMVLWTAQRMGPAGNVANSSVSKPLDRPVLFKLV